MSNSPRANWRHRSNIGASLLKIWWTSSETRLPIGMEFNESKKRNGNLKAALDSGASLDDVVERQSKLHDAVEEVFADDPS